MNPRVFKIKMEHWLDSVAYVNSHLGELSGEERDAVKFLTDAWRDNDYSEKLIEKAKQKIDILVRNDERHGNLPELKTKIQRFRGAAASIYTSSAEDYDQFRTELCLRHGVNIPSSPTPSSPSTPSPTPATPPPPPPPRGRAEFHVEQSGIDIVSERGSVLRGMCTWIPEGTSRLRPSVDYHTTVVGSRWKITCRLVESAGREVRIVVKDVTVPTARGTLTLPPFPDCTDLPPGEYRLLTYVNGDLRSDNPLTISPKINPAPAPVKLQIKEVISVDSVGNPMASEFLTTAQFLAIVVKLSSPSATQQSQRLRVAIYDPTGNLIRVYSSPPGFTFSQTVDFRSTAEIMLELWGDSTGRHFSKPGNWTVKVALDDGTQDSYTFTVKRPYHTTPVLNITGVDFFMDLTGDKSIKKKYAPAPNVGDDRFCPHIQFNTVSAVSVVEISYTIFPITEKGQKPPIFRSKPKNYYIGGSSDKLLEIEPLGGGVFQPGSYGIEFTVNGAKTPVHEFTVKETKPFHWQPFIAIVLTIISFILGFFVL